MKVLQVSLDEGELALGAIAQARIAADVSRTLVRREMNRQRTLRGARAEHYRAASFRSLHGESAGVLDRRRQRDLLRSAQQGVDAPERAVDRAHAEEHALLGRVGQAAESHVLVVVGVERE